MQFLFFFSLLILNLIYSLWKQPKCPSFAFWATVLSVTLAVKTKDLAPAVSWTNLISSCILICIRDYRVRESCSACVLTPSWSHKSMHFRAVNILIRISSFFLGLHLQNIQQWEGVHLLKPQQNIQ